MNHQTITAQIRVSPCKSNFLNQILADFDKIAAVVKVSYRITIIYKAILKISPRSLYNNIKSGDLILWVSQSWMDFSPRRGKWRASPQELHLLHWFLEYFWEINLNGKLSGRCIGVLWFNQEHWIQTWYLRVVGSHILPVKSAKPLVIFL